MCMSLLKLEHNYKRLKQWCSEDILRPGQEIFLRPRQQKLLSLKCKIGGKDAEEAKIKHFLKLFCSFSIVIILIY